MAALSGLVQSGRNAWNASACTSQRLPILHQMQHEARQHKTVEALEQSVLNGFSQQL